jgi:hypothetical protein
MVARRIGIRWTIGDVSPEGFEALRLSVWGAYRVFGDAAGYTICVNTVALPQALRRTGDLPRPCIWREATREIPTALTPYLDAGMAAGAGWKLAPLRVFPDRHELSLDNDCILWSQPDAIRRWLEAGDDACLLAEDVRACFGKFARGCGPEPRNAGIRGLPPYFDLERAMLDVLRTYAVKLSSELDEQGLQVMAVSRAGSPIVVPLTAVTICSPFPPHLPNLGQCGAHFCGLNARDLGWELDGRPASAHVRQHWRSLRAELFDRVGLPLPPDATTATADAATGA